MEYTANLRLKKPDLNDYVNVNDLNENADAIDGKFGNFSELKTSDKTTFVNVVNELFTSVSNGKQLIGTAITDADDSLIVPTKPTHAQLADLIRNISTGKKMASGTLISDALGVTTISGLSFAPSVIIFHFAPYTKDRRAGVAVNFNSYELRVDLYNDDSSIVTGRTTEWRSDGLVFVHGQVNNECKWIAFE